MKGLSVYVNCVAWVALLAVSLVSVLPALISAKDTMLVVGGFGYAAVLVPVLVVWAKTILKSFK